MECVVRYRCGGQLLFERPRVRARPDALHECLEGTQGKGDIKG